VIGKHACTRPVAQVATAFGVSHSVVQQSFESVATQEIEHKGGAKENQPLCTPRFLGLDECATRKGHRSDTIVCDVQARRVLEVRAGRKLEDVTAVLERRSDPDAVKAVSMEMSASVRPAVPRWLPKAQIVVDHVPVIQHVMKGFQKGLSRWAHKKEGKALVERKQHLFLKAKEDLTEEHAKERIRIGEPLPFLERAWQRKEAFRAWYATAPVAPAAREMDAWIEQVQHQGPEHLRNTLSAFTHGRSEMLALFQCLPVRMSNGFVEGKNHRTKALMRQAYVYCNRLHLRLRMFAGDLVGTFCPFPPKDWRSTSKGPNFFANKHARKPRNREYPRFPHFTLFSLFWGWKAR
jgi:transposase